VSSAWIELLGYLAACLSAMVGGVLRLSARR
jgi:hypothetical protein